MSDLFIDVKYISTVWTVLETVRRNNLLNYAQQIIGDCETWTEVEMIAFGLSAVSHLVESTPELNKLKVIFELLHTPLLSAPDASSELVAPFAVRSVSGPR